MVYAGGSSWLGERREEAKEDIRRADRWDLFRARSAVGGGSKDIVIVAVMNWKKDAAKTDQ